MMLQLNPSIPVDTPKGSGQATFLIDYSSEHDLYWVVFIDKTCECWTFNNRDIRAQKNYTMGRIGEEKKDNIERLAPVGKIMP